LKEIKKVDQKGNGNIVIKFHDGISALDFLNKTENEIIAIIKEDQLANKTINRVIRSN